MNTIEQIDHLIEIITEIRKMRSQYTVHPAKILDATLTADTKEEALFLLEFRSTLEYMTKIKITKLEIK